MEYLYLFPVALALLALSTRSLDFKGAFVSLLLAFAVLEQQNIYWLSMLLVFFVVGTIATKVRAEYKKQYGLFQKVRSTENVIGNGGIALLMALIGNPYGFLGALSTATADTLSSEIGVLSSRRPRLITNLKRVQTGTDGAVSALGLVSSVVGVLAIAAVAFVFCMYGGFGEIDVTKLMIITIASGIFGCTVDSVVGATIERRGVFDNWKTNFVATGSGALFAIILGFLL
jgi:uncharacterized protein (TIGR00297 family)